MVLRGAVVAAASLVIGGCGTSRGGGAGSAASPSPSQSGTAASALGNDVRLLTLAISSEEQLLNFATTASRRFPTKRAELALLVSQQQLRVAKLRASLTDLKPPVTHNTPRVPLHVADLPAATADVASRTWQRRAADCQAATSGLLAELFGSLAAAHAVTVHAWAPERPVSAVSVPPAVQHVAGLQPCLAAEHAAVFGYGQIAGVMSAGVSDNPVASAAVTSYDAHRSRRDTLIRLVTQGGEKPVAAEAAYDTGAPVTGAASAVRLARDIEGRCSVVYARAIASMTGNGRDLVSTTLVACAVRRVEWGAAPLVFPGLGVT